MDKNIFEGAKFGDKFVTRDGRLALAVSFIEGYIFLYVKGHGSMCYHIKGNGRTKLSVEDDIDIVSRYQESIDEEKLDEMATKECSDKFIGSDDMADIVCNITNDLEQAVIDAYMIGFKMGYRKAMEE